LQVAKNGQGRSWIFRYTFHGQPREMGLGPLKKVGLSAARQAAKKYWEMVHPVDPDQEAVDPVDQRRARRAAAQVQAAKAGATFRKCAKELIVAKRAEWTNPKHADQWESTLSTYVYPAFGDKPVDGIDTELVLQVLQPIWTTKTETATRVRQRIEAVLEFAKARGWRSGENPARWRGHLDHMLAKPSKAKDALRRETGRGEHQAALPYNEIAECMASSRARNGVSARALEFTVLTAMRSETVIGAPCREIDWAQRIWHIPESRVLPNGKRVSSGLKRKGDFDVPLSDAAIAVLEAAGAYDAVPDRPLFPSPQGGGRLSNTAMRKCLQDDLGYGKRATPHGMRSTFRDWAGDCTNYPHDLIELALAHTLPSRVEAAYRRGTAVEKRRHLMNDWARFCQSGDAALAGNVVPIRGTASGA
jgi:integrase